MAKIIVDAGPLAALFRTADEYHEWALEIFGSLPTPFYTTEPAITEAAYFLVSAGIHRRREVGELSEQLGFEQRVREVGRVVRAEGAIRAP